MVAVPEVAVAGNFAMVHNWFVIAVFDVAKNVILFKTSGSLTSLKPKVILLQFMVEAT